MDSKISKVKLMPRVLSSSLELNHGAVPISFSKVKKGNYLNPDTEFWQLLLFPSYSHTASAHFRGRSGKYEKHFYA